MKNGLKVVSFLMGFIVLLFISSYIFMPKNNNTKFGIRQVSANGILGEPENTMDALFLGDSLVYTSISPMIIWEEYGITSYDLATSAQYLYETYEFLDKALVTQKPKIVFLETNAFFRKYKVVNVIGAEGKKIFPVFEYHDRWKNLTINDFINDINYTWTDYNKGYRFKTNVNSAEDVHKDYMKKTTDLEHITKLNYKYIEKIIKRCKSEGIEIVLLSTPTMKNCNYGKYLAIKNIAKEFDVEHLDLNLEVNLNIDWSSETLDKGDHLNYKGAQKVSEYLGNYLNKKGFVSHKEDSHYDTWHQDLKNYKAKIAKEMR